MLGFGRNAVDAIVRLHGSSTKLFGSIVIAWNEAKRSDLNSQPTGPPRPTPSVPGESGGRHRPARSSSAWGQCRLIIQKSKRGEVKAFVFLGFVTHGPRKNKAATYPRHPARFLSPWVRVIAKSAVRQKRPSPCYGLRIVATSRPTPSGF